jgi:5-methylthioadenosine/S-adenosylhomocysteine deaminase
MLDFLFVNAMIVTVDPERRILDKAALAVSGSTIAGLGDAESLLRELGGTRRTIDCRGKVIFPGLINTHNHLFQTLLKGLGDDRVLADWFAQMTGPSAVHLQPEDCYVAALLGCIEGLHSGVTTQFDYMYPHPREGLDDEIVRAFRELGLRGILGRGMMDCGAEFGVPEGIMQPLEVIVADCERLLDTYHGADEGRIRVWLAPAAVWSNSRDLLLAVRDLAARRQTGISVHISETLFDREASVKLHGRTDIEVLESLGLMGPNLLMVHCVHLTPRDLRMTRYHEARVSHNPVSNMYLSSGVAPVPAMVAQGITVGLATDGAASNNSNDMLEVLKASALLHKVHTCDPTIITAEKVLEMATIDGARALGLDREIGSLEIGKKADLFVYNPLASARSVPMHHPVSTLVYSSGPEGVEMVVVDGRIVLEDGKVTALDERALLSRAQEVAEGLADRAGTAALARRPWRSLAY